jgi:hypothetical protein
MPSGNRSITAKCGLLVAEDTKRGREVKRAIVMALSVILALVVAIPMASGKPEPTANKSQTLGKKILGELGAEWWIWIVEEPIATNPFLGSYNYKTDDVAAKKCDGSNPSGVWFLAGSGDGTEALRECVVPRETQIFFPIVTRFEGDPTENSRGEEEFRRIVNEFMDQALDGSTMFVTVDGEPLPVSIAKQRADTPLFTFVLPEGNIFGAPPVEGEGVADGVWVLLPPLSKGTHTIHFGGTFPNADLDPSMPGPEGFSQDITYKLKVK